MALLPSRLGNTEKVLAVVLLISVLGFATLVGVVHRGFEALSGARAYVAGEAQWSKAQKDAVHHLVHYALHGEEERYRRFLGELDVIQGDRQARLELESADPDMDRVRDGFLRGRNHPEDLDRLAGFFVRYRDTPHVQRAVAAWEEGDELVEELMEVGAEIRREREAGAGPVDLAPLLEEVDDLNERLTVLETRFSRELGEGARWTQALLFRVVLGTAAGLVLVMGGLGWILTRRLRRAEASVRASEERYRGLYENSPFGIYRTGPDGRIVEANPTLVGMLGASGPGEVLGVDSRTLFPERLEAASGPRTHRDGVEAHSLRDDVLPPRDLEVEGPDGQSRVLKLTGRVLQDANETPDGHEMYVEDVTRTRRLEEQLREARKMEAVGHLTAGIAQDFNNLLTVVISSASLARREVQPENGEVSESVEKALSNLDLVDRSAAQAAEIVEKLVAFSRRSPLQLRPVDLPALVEASRQLVGRSLPSPVELRLVLEEECPPVSADPQAVERILLNLARNAGDAMPEGGVLEISVAGRRPSPDDGHAPSSGDEVAEEVVLTVKDTGAGMSEEARERAFEPFFTTKGTSAGNGLGLAMVHGLVRQHEGEVELRSEEGEGTVVEVTLLTAPA